MSVAASQKLNSFEQVQPLSQKNDESFSKTKIILCALAIIASLGCLATGVCGYFQVGLLSTLNQVYAIVLMAVGSVLAVVGVILGLCSTQLKNNKASNSNDIEDVKQRAQAQEAKNKIAEKTREEKEARVKEEKRKAAEKAQQDKELIEAEEKAKANKKQQEATKAQAEKAARELAEAKAMADKDAAEKTRREKEARDLPSILDLKLNPASPLLQELPSNIFYRDVFGTQQLDLDLLRVPLQIWVNPDSNKWGFFAQNHIDIVSDPMRKVQADAINNRIEALDRAVKIKERLRRLKDVNHSLQVGHLLSAWPDGILRFMLMTDGELSQLKVSDIQPKRDNKKLWDVLCNRLCTMAKTKSPKLPKLNQADIGNLLLTDLTKISASHINSFPNIFPRITFLLIDLQEFKNIDLSKVANPKEIVEEIFEGPYGDREESRAAKRLLSCEPQTIYQLSPYLPKQVWRLLDPPLLSQLDFSRVFAGMKEEKDKIGIVEEIFEGPYGDREKSRAAKRLLACEPQTIYQLSRYLPKLVWGLLDQPLLSRLDFSQIFANIKDENHKKSLIEAIFEGPYGDGKNSRAAKRLLSMHPSQVGTIRPYLPALVTKFIT